MKKIFNALKTIILWVMMWIVACWLNIIVCAILSTMGTGNIIIYALLEWAGLVTIVTATLLTLCVKNVLCAN